MGSATETAASGGQTGTSAGTPETEAAAQAQPGPAFAVVEEVRLAVVMYGGVSLSIYMNGVAQEMFHLVRATAPATPAGATAIPDGELTPTERVYRSVAQLDPDAPDAPGDAAADLRRRFVIDVLSGTSAGGINAVFLAKALANHQPMDGLTNLWLDEGDVGKLVNDKGSWMEGVPRESPPQSLLNSGRMYNRLLFAFHQMDELHPWDPERPSTLAEAVDLFVTTTDLYGFQLPIRLANARATERRYRNVYHLAYSASELRPGQPEQNVAANPFVRANNPFLAFACRCTSAFPLAFQPMTLADIDHLVTAFPEYADRTSDTAEWRAFYPDYATPPDPDDPNPLAFKDRPFADGGALDNKPFGWAVDILRSRRAQVPVDRKLVFVEPDPTPETRSADPRGRPDALRNALAQGVLLPRQETVRDDLNRVDDLNRLARRVDTALGKVIEHIDTPQAETAEVRIRRTPAEDLDAHPTAGAAEAPGEPPRPAGYHGYLALRDEDVLEDLADLVVRLAPLPSGGEYTTAVRALLKAWRDSRYGDDEHTPLSLERFLWTFDQHYRLRRLAFMERRTDSVFRWDRDGRELVKKFGIEPDAVRPDELRQALTFVKQGITRATQVLADAESDLRGRGESNPLPGQIRASGIDLTALKKVYQSPTDAERANVARSIVEPNLEAIDRVLLSVSVARTGAAQLAFEALAESLIGAFPDAPPAPSTERRLAAAIGAWAYRRFDEFDMVAFPLQYGSEAGEGDQVEVLRISPGDAIALTPRQEAPAPGPGKHGDGAGKVTGARVFHFGAFLDRLWRENDIMWGRLDAAEILIETLVPQGEGHDAAVASLRHDAFRAIMREELTDADTAQLFTKGREQMAAGVALGERLRQLVEAAEPPAGMASVFEATYERPEHLPRREMLDDVGRGAAVAGQVLQGIAHARGEGRPPIPFRLAARIGLIGAGIVAAAVPTSEDHQRVRLRFLLVYLAEAAGISVGFWQDWPVLTKFAIGAFVLTAAANAGLWLVAGLLKLGSLRSSWLWVTGSLALALAAGGVLTLAVFQMLRTADGPWLWLVSAVALGLIALGVLARTPPARQAGAPPATEDEQRRAKRRRWIRLALIALGAGWFLVMGWLQLVHVGETRDWIPIVSHPSPPAA